MHLLNALRVNPYVLCIIAAGDIFNPRREADGWL